VEMLSHRMKTSPYVQEMTIRRGDVPSARSHWPARKTSGQAPRASLSVFLFLPSVAAAAGSFQHLKDGKNITTLTVTFAKLYMYDER